jgi:hypothetical protein
VPSTRIATVAAAAAGVHEAVVVADVLDAMEAFGTHCRRGINFARETPVGDAATLPHDAARAFGRAALGGERLEDLVRFLAVACDFEAVLEARLECVASIAVEYGREALLHLHKGRCFGGGATCARASSLANCVRATYRRVSFTDRTCEYIYMYV